MSCKGRVARSQNDPLRPCDPNGGKELFKRSQGRSAGQKNRPRNSFVSKGSQGRKVAPLRGVRELRPSRPRGNGLKMAESPLWHE